MSEGLASELLDTRVRVTVVFPGAVVTNIRANSGVCSPKVVEAGGLTSLPPSTAAEIIVHGMEKDEPRVFVGKDAALMDKFYRLSPAYAARTIANKIRALLLA